MFVQVSAVQRAAADLHGRLWTITRSDENCNRNCHWRSSSMWVKAISWRRRPTGVSKVWVAWSGAAATTFKAGEDHLEVEGISDDA